MPLQVQSDGRIVVMGATILFPEVPTFLLARYESEGSVDPTFSGGIKLTSSPGTVGAFASGLVIQPHTDRRGGGRPRSPQTV